MKNIFGLIVVASVILACNGVKKEKSAVLPVSGNLDHIVEEYELPPLEKVGAGALLSAGLIYSLDNRPTPETHASTIVETPLGLVSAFFSGTHERHPDVGIRISRFEKGQWTWPEEVADGVQNDTLRFPAWNPVLFLPENGPLLLFYKVGPNPREWWGMVKTSGDYGKTWSDAKKIGENDAIGHLLGPVKNKPIQLSDGTIISPSSVELKEDGSVKWQVHFEVSKDQGKTWEVIGPINDGENFDAIQPSILTFPDGRLMVLCRTRQGVISRAWSDDQGRSWSKMEAVDLPNPNSGTDAVTLKDGRQLLIYNHKLKKGQDAKGRDILNLAISSDGISWTPVMTLENEPLPEGYAYPAIIQTSDSLVHATYTYNRKSIKHVVIDPRKLE